MLQIKEYLGYYEVGYLIGNFNGSVDLQNNCFFDNQVTIAPVINQGRLLAVNNSGRQAMVTTQILIPQAPTQKMSRSVNAEQHALSTTGHNVTSHMLQNVSMLQNISMDNTIPIDHENARCEFIADISEADLGALKPELIPVACVDFDTSQCVNPTAPSSAPSIAPTVSPRPSVAPLPTSASFGEYASDDSVPTSPDSVASSSGLSGSVATIKTGSLALLLALTLFL
jgi:hypothetical protein